MNKALLILSFLLVMNVRSEAQVKEGPALAAGIQTSVLRFYPNPATTVISFDFQRGYEKGYSLQVYNMLGRKMIEQSNLSDRTTVNLSEFIRGVYVYKLFDKNGRLVESGKFQVSK